MRPIFRALFGHISHYSAILPYNLNWGRVRWGSLAPLFARSPIHVIDVGARGGCPEELASLRGQIDYVAFDADAKEAERLAASPPAGFRKFSMLPYFIGPDTGRKTFHLFEGPGDSSALPPNPSYRRFSPDFGVARDVTVEATTLDELAAQGRLSDVDVLKLDTQGTEYDILAASPWALQRALLVEAEVEFIEMYLGQKLFFDVHRLMHEKGFELLYLNRVFIRRHAYHGPARGQLIFGDALFGLREDLARQLPLGKKAKYVVLLIQYGHLDFAQALYASSAELQAEYPQLAGHFHVYHGLFSKLKRAAGMQLDKLILLLLHLRGTNQLPSDSDRSWPVR
jgi:FkbM family methyltransferase